jgi:hypothetical protein
MICGVGLSPSIMITLDREYANPKIRINSRFGRVSYRESSPPGTISTEHDYVKCDLPKPISRELNQNSEF